MELTTTVYLTFVKYIKKSTQSLVVDDVAADHVDHHYYKHNHVDDDQQNKMWINVKNWKKYIEKVRRIISFDILTQKGTHTHNTQQLQIINQNLFFYIFLFSFHYYYCYFTKKVIHNLNGWVWTYENDFYSSHAKKKKFRIIRITNDLRKIVKT